MSQNTGFYTFNEEHAQDNLKYKRKEKHEKKLLWLVLSAKGILTLFIGTTKGPAVTTNVYIKECLSKLFTFIETYYSHDDCILAGPCIIAWYTKFPC